MLYRVIVLSPRRGHSAASRLPAASTHPGRIETSRPCGRTSVLDAIAHQPCRSLDRRSARVRAVGSPGAGSCAAGDETLAVLRSGSCGCDELGDACTQAVVAHIGEPAGLQILVEQIVPRRQVGDRLGASSGTRPGRTAQAPMSGTTRPKYRPWPQRSSALAGRSTSSRPMRPPGRSTRASSANRGGTAVRLRRANPHVAPSSAPAGRGSSSTSALTSAEPPAVSRAAARSIPIEKSKPTP